MTVACWSKMVRIITSSLRSLFSERQLICVLINDFLLVSIHIGFHNVVLCYYHADRSGNTFTECLCVVFEQSLWLT